MCSSFPTVDMSTGEIVHVQFNRAKTFGHFANRAHLLDRHQSLWRASLGR